MLTVADIDNGKEYNGELAAESFENERMLCGDCPDWQAEQKRVILPDTLPVLFGKCDIKNKRCDRCAFCTEGRTWGK